MIFECGSHCRPSIRRQQFYRANGATAGRVLGRAWLALADSMLPGQGDATTLAVLANSPRFDKATQLDRPALAAARDSHLRALVQLADRPGAALRYPDANGVVRRLLLAIYDTGARLDSLDAENGGLQTRPPQALGTGTEPAFSALAQLVNLQPQKLPLAALLHVHLLSCHGPASRQAEVLPSLVVLQAVPVSAPGSGHYLSFASAVELRRKGGKPLCLLMPAVAG